MEYGLDSRQLTHIGNMSDAVLLLVTHYNVNQYISQLLQTYSNTQAWSNQLCILIKVDLLIFKTHNACLFEMSKNASCYVNSLDRKQALNSSLSSDLMTTEM